MQHDNHGAGAAAPPARMCAVRAVALFDLAVTLPLALPVLGAWWVAILLSGFGLLDHPRDYLPLTATMMVFVHLAGVLGALWNSARAWRPLPWLVTMDCIGRVAVAALLLYLLLRFAVPPVLWLFVVTELAGAVIGAAAVRRTAAS